MRIPLILTLFFSLLTMLSAQNNGGWNNDGRRVSGNGDVVTQDRPVTSDFTRIEAGNAIQVELTQDSKRSIRVEADENLLPYLITEVSGKTLRLGIKPNSNIRNATKMKIYVSLPQLEAIEAGGASMVETMTAFEGDKIDIDAGSAAQVKVEFNGRSLNASVGSAGILRLKGSADKVILEASSAGVIRGDDFTGKDVEAEANSAGSIEVRVTDELNAKANSAGSIRYQGKPNRIYTDSNSGGRVKGSR